MSPLIVIVGETASGKSALALDLAEQFDGELICADSWTVYKGFDIGTAKPSPKEQAEVSHHLLDVVDPRDGFSAAEFQRLAIAAIDDISRRDKLPIMVGGSGLYVDSVLYSYEFPPKADPRLREELNMMSLADLQALAAQRDYNAEGVDMQNKRRVIRLIENNGQRPTKHELRGNTCIIGLTRSREELKERITDRIEAMTSAGFPDEVRRLGHRYGWNAEAMRAPGYRAFAGYVRGELTLEEAKFLFVQNDLRLAKKQRTWFRRNPSIQWLDGRSNAVDIVTTFLNKN